MGEDVSFVPSAEKEKMLETITTEVQSIQSPRK